MCWNQSSRYISSGPVRILSAPTLIAIVLSLPAQEPPVIKTNFKQVLAPVVVKDGTIKEVAHQPPMFRRCGRATTIAAHISSASILYTPQSQTSAESALW